MRSYCCIMGVWDEKSDERISKDALSAVLSTTVIAATTPRQGARWNRIAVFLMTSGAGGRKPAAGRAKTRHFSHRGTPNQAAPSLPRSSSEIRFA
jgi:hypothetical protein